MLFNSSCVLIHHVPLLSIVGLNILLNIFLLVINYTDIQNFTFYDYQKQNVPILM